MLRELRNTCWTGKGLITEVDEKGKRRVSWDYIRGGPKSFKWVPWGASKPTVSQSLNPTLAQNGLGSNKSNEACFSSPSIYELGESSSLTKPKPLAHLETSALAPLEQPDSLLPTVAELERQIQLSMPINCNCSDEINSNRLTVAKIGVGINSDDPAAKLMEYNSSCLDGKSSDSPAVEGWEVGTSSDGPVKEPMEINFAGFNSVDPTTA
nr:hypothetical protein CFP56_25252 [Quercus suber]